MRVDLESSGGLVTTMGMACRREGEGEGGGRRGRWREGHVSERTNGVSDLVREEEGGPIKGSSLADYLSNLGR